MSGKIEKLLHKLDLTIKSGNISRIQFLCNKLLEQGYEGDDVKKVLAVSHIKMKSFKLALVTLNTLSPIDMIFEKAYCYYWLNDFEKALKLLRDSDEKSDPRITELLAQIYYNLNEFDKSLEMYSELEKIVQDDNQPDRYTNICAVKAAASSFYGSSNTFTVDNNDNYNDRYDSYENHYNKACFYIGQGNYVTALKSIEESLISIMKHTNNQVLTEFEKNDLAMIIVQMSFIEHKLGNYLQAKRLLESDPIKYISTTDFTLQMVATNNHIALLECIYGKYTVQWSKNMGKLYDKIKKLSHSQNVIYLYNAFVMGDRCGHVEQRDDCLDKLKSTKCSYNLNELILMAETHPSLISSIKNYNSINSNQIDSCIKALEDLINNSMTHSLDIYIRLANFYRLKNNVAMEIITLKKYPYFYYSPTLVTYIYKLEFEHGHIEDAIQTLLQCAKTCSYKHGYITAIIVELMTLFIKTNRLEDGNHTIMSLINETINKSNIPHLKNVIEFFITNICFDNNSNSINDIEKLDLTYVFITLKKFFDDYNKNNVTNIHDHGSNNKSRRKRKTISKILANGNNTKPDPERWFPKYERSTYKPDKKRRKNPNFRGTQGVSEGGNVISSYEINSIQPSVVKSQTAHSNLAAKINKAKKKKRRH